MNTKPPKIKHIHIFGMRCSGTNHMEKTLKLNLKQGVSIGNAIGWKHDDLWSPAAIVDEKTNQIHYYERPTPDILPESLVIVVYRNPIPWLRSLQQKPHHAPKSFGLDFSTFIRSPFESFWTPPGRDFTKGDKERFSYLRNDRLHNHYPNPLVMRRTDIAMFESFKYRVPNACYVNLETLIRHPEALLQALARHYDMPLKSGFKANDKEKHSDAAYAEKRYPKMRAKDLAHIVRSLDLKTEQRIGYKLQPQQQLPRLLGAGAPPLKSLFATEHKLRMYSYERGDSTVELTS